jgi:putative membrane protein
MRYLIRLFWAVLFLFLLSFATKNTETIVLRYYFNYEWRAPLILVLLLFLAFGVVIGILSCLGKFFKQRREIITFKKSCSVTNEHK